MGSLLVYWDSNSNYSYYSGVTIAQTFIVPSGYDTLDVVELPLVRTAGSGGTITVSIYATSGGVPTGSALATSTKNCNDVSTSGSSYYSFTLSSPLTVTGGATYAVGMIATTSTIAWWRSSTASYAYGQGFNNASGWTDWGRDLCFKVYGYQSATAPLVTSSTASGILGTSFTFTGIVTSDGGATVTSRGGAYSKTNATPTIADSTSTTSGTTGTYNVAVSGVLEGSTYFVRAFATNSQGTGYGSKVDVTTTSTYSDVTTTGVSDITCISAKGLGNVTSEHGSAVTERGFVLNTGGSPTITSTKFVASTGGAGTYEVNLTGLSANTTYHSKAYATNAIGTSYGSESDFTTVDIVSQYAQQFTASKTGTLSKIAMYLKLNYGTSGTPTMKVYSDSGDLPNALQQTIVLSPLTSSTYSWVEGIANVSIVSGTKYWVVLDTPYVIGSYEVYWGYNATTTYGLLKKKMTATSSYATVTGTTAFKVYQQPATIITANVAVSYKQKYL